MGEREPKFLLFHPMHPLLQKRAGQSCKSCKNLKLFRIHSGGERTFVGLHAVAKRGNKANGKDKEFYQSIQLEADKQTTHCLLRHKTIENEFNLELKLKELQVNCFDGRMLIVKPG